MKRKTLRKGTTVGRTLKGDAEDSKIGLTILGWWTWASQGQNLLGLEAEPQQHERRPGLIEAFAMRLGGFTFRMAKFDTLSKQVRIIAHY